MTTNKTNTLSLKQKAEVKALHKISEQVEQLKNMPQLSNELNTDQDLPCFFLSYEKDLLVGFLSAFFPTRAEVEVNGFVHPQYRSKGIFSSLVSDALETYGPQGFLQMLFEVESSSRSGKAYIGKRYPHIDRSEFRLRLSKSRWQEYTAFRLKGATLVEATGENLEVYCQTAACLLREDIQLILQMLGNPERKGYLYRYDNKPVGVLQKCKEEGDLSMLYAVAIDEAYRGQGHGKAMLALALDSLFLSSESIFLEVDSQNPKALGLYGSLGFEIEFQTDYHALNLSYL